MLLKTLMDLPIPNDPSAMWIAAVSVTMLLGILSTIFTLQQRQQMSLQRELIEGLQLQVKNSDDSERRCRDELMSLRPELENQKRLVVKLRAIIKRKMPNIRTELEDTDEFNAVEFEKVN